MLSIVVTESDVDLFLLYCAKTNLNEVECRMNVYDVDECSLGNFQKL